MVSSTPIKLPKVFTQQSQSFEELRSEVAKLSLIENKLEFNHVFATLLALPGGVFEL